ncbi:MAG: hypothetical protein H6945_15535 [Zoogloeaceae bacterium]|nr:hypothetical protein [Rhodocyclaceae bacterium]MCP5237149.1 hypothetical protein [Zoogloeaceae bacterium]
MKFMLAAALVGLAPALANATCQTVTGSVFLVPEVDSAGNPACTVSTMIDDASFAAGQCFSVNLSLFGLPAGRGFAGVTHELAVGVDDNATISPLTLLESGDPLPGDTVPMVRNQVLTARSAIGIGFGPFRTVVYSSDVIVVRPQGAAAPIVTEQIVISGTDGKGLFRNASGHFAVLGNSIGQSAPVVGQLCF